MAFIIIQGDKEGDFMNLDERAAQSYGFKNMDEAIDHELTKNPELRKVFEEYPEKRELYKQKIIDSYNESGGYSEEEKNKRCKFCKTCLFSHGEPPFADLPEKSYCMIYTRESTTGKPKAVYYDGARCEYYANEEDAE